MITLIAGGTHTGKTLLAQRLLEKHHVPCLSIDHIKMGLIRSGVCPLSPESSDRELTAYLWPVIKEIIKTNIENGQNLIVEGCYIPFDYQNDFTQMYLQQIQYTCLILGRAYIENHFHDILAHENAIEQRMGSEYCTQELLLAENEYHLKMCKKYALHYVLIENEYPVKIDLFE